VNSTLLVADEDELHVRFDRLQSIEDRDRRAAGVAEDVFDAEIGEGLDERLRAVHFLITHDDWGENCEFDSKSAWGMANHNQKLAKFELSWSF
jgi:hypothetical protein